MLERFRDWLDQHPQGRQLLMVGVGGFLLLLLGVLIALNQGHPSEDPEGPGVAVTDTPYDGTDPAGLDPRPDRPDPPPVGQARRPRAAWISEKEVPARAQPGLNVPPIRNFEQWEEVAWIQESDNWDQIRLKNGQEAWVQSKFLTFTKPVNLDKPNPAELTVMAFYQAVARKDYAAAYSYLAPPWKAELSFDDFVDGYTRTLSLRTEIARVVQLSPERWQVDVSMIADELGRDVPYLGSYIVERAGDGWDMASGSLMRQAGAPSVHIPVAPDPGAPPPGIPPGPPVEVPSDSAPPATGETPPVETPAGTGL